MSRSLLWLSNEAWAAIAPHLPQNQPEARPVDDRRVISRIIHMLYCGGRRGDVAPEYGLSTTVCNRWNCWGGRGIWTCIVSALTEEGWIAETAQIDSSYIKVRRCAGGAKGGAKERHGSLSGRSCNQGPCARGRHRAAAPPRPDAGQHLRHPGRRPAGGRYYQNEAHDRGPRLRRQQAPRDVESREHDPGHPRPLAAASGPSNTTNDATRTAGASTRCSAASRRWLRRSWGPPCRHPL